MLPWDTTSPVEWLTLPSNGRIHKFDYSVRCQIAHDYPSHKELICPCKMMTLMGHGEWGILLPGWLKLQFSFFLLFVCSFVCFLNTWLYFTRQAFPKPLGNNDNVTPARLQISSVDFQPTQSYKCIWLPAIVRQIQTYLHTISMGLCIGYNNRSLLRQSY